MVEVRSALEGHLKPGRHGSTAAAPGIVLREVTGRDLVQVAGWRDTMAAVAGRLAAELALPGPPAIGEVREAGAIAAIMTGPDRIWVTGPRGPDLLARLARTFRPAEAVVTELGHSRTVVRIAGERARDLLMRFVAIDLDPARFPAGRCASVGVHGIGCLLHHVMEESGVPVYDLYVPCTFALSLFEALAEVAEQWGYELIA